MTEFIFFLTYNDKTVSEAMSVFEEVKDSGVKNIGFKDVGIPWDELATLKESIDEAGLNSFLEVVSEDRESTLRSAKNAVKLGADYLIGGYGEYAEEIMEIIEGADIKFYPYIGKVSGIPGVLQGEIDQMVDEAKEKEEMGVEGIDLLAYRYKGDPQKLMKEVIRAVDIPIIVAGSINSPGRIEQVVEAGAAMFTIGTAIFDRKFSPSDNLVDQISTILKCLNR